MRRVGLIGLGNMGRGMALSLARASIPVWGLDASAQAMRELEGRGITMAGSIAELLAQVDMVILSLPTSAIIESVTLGINGLLATPKPGVLVVDTSTADPASTRRIAAALSRQGMRFIDAPVSGGPKGALHATMTMVLGGSVGDIADAMPVLELLTARRVHVGPVGAGHVAKLLNNLLCASHLLLAGEAARIAREAGLDAERIFEGINAGSGRSAVTEVNYPTWIFNETFDSGFTMKLMRKDVALARALLSELAVAAPMSVETARLWAASEGRLDDGEDFNRIVDFLES